MSFTNEQIRELRELLECMSVGRYIIGTMYVHRRGTHEDYINIYADGVKYTIDKSCILFNETKVGCISKYEDELIWHWDRSNYEWNPNYNITTRLCLHNILNTLLLHLYFIPLITIISKRPPHLSTIKR